MFIVTWIIVKKCLFLARRKLKKLGNLLKAHLRELFLTTLLTNETVPPERVKRLVKSLGQDNITRGKLKTAKHTRLGVYVIQVTD